MENKLIKGGIYTINDSCYVLIKAYKETNDLRFLEVKPVNYDLESVKTEVESFIINRSKQAFFNKITMFNEIDFKKNYDGFIGNLGNFLTNMLEKHWLNCYKNFYNQQ